MDEFKAAQNRVQHAILGTLVAFFMEYNYPEVDLGAIFVSAAKEHLNKTHKVNTPIFNNTFKF
jgi:hypothetical protein